ncbi:hypothetical protein BS639_23165 [Rouxiella silvae]|uniref:Uncharacterized protein n=1 Tax=Rouxiella silvae TaxID=1646373 RepID=A0ABX3TUD8_9GAMM|nr:hypothetical protein BS639_23165 [Rouxiella silvae]
MDKAGTNNKELRKNMRVYAVCVSARLKEMPMKVMSRWVVASIISMNRLLTADEGRLARIVQAL